MGPKAVTDSGPLIHLDELTSVKALKIFDVLTTTQVRDEIKNLALPHFIKLFPASADSTTFYCLKYDIGLGEASCITLCLHEKIKLFLTDDLSARIASKKENLDPHGTIGVLLRAYREGLFTKLEIIEILRSIKQKSTLFITQRLIEYAITEVKRRS